MEEKLDLQEFHADRDRNQGWNIRVNLCDGAFSNLAFGLVSMETILSVFISALTDSKQLVGLMCAILVLGTCLPQLLSAYYTEHRGAKKRFILLFSVGDRLFLLLFGIIGGLWASQILKTNSFPNSYALYFICAFVFYTVSLFFIFISRESRCPDRDRGPRLQGYLKKLLVIWKENPKYRRFLIAVAVLSLAGLAVPFYSVYAIRELKIALHKVGIFTSILLASQAGTAVLWGYLGSRKGYRVIFFQRYSPQQLL